MMENESLMKLDVPEFWYEHDENGKRVSLSYIGCLAVMSVGIAIAHRIADYIFGSARTQKDEVLK